MCEEHTVVCLNRTGSDPISMSKRRREMPKTKAKSKPKTRVAKGFKSAPKTNFEDFLDYTRNSVDSAEITKTIKNFLKKEHPEIQTSRYPGWVFGPTYYNVAACLYWKNTLKKDFEPRSVVSREYMPDGEIRYFKNTFFYDGEKRLKSYINFLKNEALTLEKKESSPKPAENKDVSYRNLRNAKDSIEDYISDFIDGKNVNLSVTGILELNNIPPKGHSSIKDYMNSMIEEFRDAVEKRCPQAVEGYSHIPKTRLKTLILNLEAAKKVLETDTKSKKPLPIAKQLEKFKYKSRCEKLKIDSVSPRKIIGAKMCYIYNADKRVLSKLVSSSEFEIRGTTIQNIDLEKSFAITIRKPEDVIPSILKAKTPSEITKIISTLTTKKRQTNGRSSDSVLILKSYK